FSFRFPRAYLLKPVGRREEDALSLVTIGTSKQSVLAPYSPDLEYVVASRWGAALPIESRDFRVETLGVLPSLWARLRLAFFFKKKKYLKYDEFTLFSVGPKAERKRFTRYNQDWINIGVTVDSDLAAKHPELIYGWPAGVGPAQVTDRLPGEGRRGWVRLKSRIGSRPCRWRSLPTSTMRTLGPTLLGRSEA